ncbi:MAG: hypothetical protein EA351_00700, partial [Gemmatimonadales bacterium]
MWDKGFRRSFNEREVEMGYGKWDMVRAEGRGVDWTADGASESWVVGASETTHSSDRPDGWPLGAWETMATQMVRERSTPYDTDRDSAASVDRPHDLSDLEG